MKKVLITGANSYIGTSFERWVSQYPDRYKVDTVDMKDGSWRDKDFSYYDVVFHVAGIAHVSSDPKLKDLYYRVNRDLTIETAKKAKAEGVKQFIFMSSIIVYGDSSKKKRVIDRNTIPSPSNFYGDSKLQAEIGLKALEDENFKIVILRPPMIYGKGSKGNYPKLSKDNLCEFIRLMIDNEERGLFFPQNAEYVKTSEMVRLIAEVHGRKIRLTKVFNPIIKMIFGVNMVNKVFGNLVYDRSMSVYSNGDYWIRDFRKSIELSEVMFKNV